MSDGRAGGPVRPGDVFRCTSGVAIAGVSV